jgi:hypothetical protein
MQTRIRILLKFAKKTANLLGAIKAPKLNIRAWMNRLSR